MRHRIKYNDSQEYEAFLRDCAYWECVDKLNQLQAKYGTNVVTDEMSKKSKEIVDKLIEDMLKKK